MLWPSIWTQHLFYRAERYGIISLLRFLHTMHQIYAAPPRRVACTHLIYCDNESLVTTLTQILAYNQIYPNLTVSPEWDTIVQKRDTLTQVGPKQPHILTSLVTKTTAPHMKNYHYQRN